MVLRFWRVFATLKPRLIDDFLPDNCLQLFDDSVRFAPWHLALSVFSQPSFYRGMRLNRVVSGCPCPRRKAAKTLLLQGF